MYRPYSRAMKYSFSVSLLLVFLFMAACTPGRERFTVHGNISDPLASEPGSMVYLSGPEGPMDSVAVKNGKFVLYGDKDRTKLLVVSLRFKGRDAVPGNTAIPCSVHDEGFSSPRYPQPTIPD